MSRIVIAAVLLAGWISCALAASEYDGIWSITGNVDATQCGEGRYSATYIATAATDAAGKMTFSYGLVADTALLVNSSLSFTTSYQENTGINTARVEVFFSGATLSGTVSWTWSGGGESCSGTTILVGTQTQKALAVTALRITGPASMQAGGQAQLVATAVYTDNSAKDVAAVWVASDTNVASISRAGLLVAARVAADAPVTVEAIYTEDGQTTTATKTVTITAAASPLTGLNIEGAASLQSGGQAILKAYASYTDGSRRLVYPSDWALSDPSKGSISSRGLLTTVAVAADTALKATASYREGTTVQSADMAFVIKASPSTLTRLALTGARATLDAGDSLSLAAEGVYSDGSRKRVAPRWSLSNPGAASIDPYGLLTTAKVAADTVVEVTAAHAEGSLTATASFSVLIQANAATVPLTAEIQASGTTDNYSLAIWINAAEPVALAQFALTAAKLAASADANQACAQQFGASHRLADWNEVSGYYVAGGKLPALVAALGLAAGESAWVSRAGATGGASGDKYQLVYRNRAAFAGVVAEQLDDHYVDLDSGAGERAAICFRSATARAGRAGDSGYNVYVGALVPDGSKIGAAGFFLLDRSGEWKPLAYPLAEYLSGIGTNSWQRADLFELFDARLISGTQIYVGFGSDGAEMLEAKRYRVVYQIP